MQHTYKQTHTARKRNKGDQAVKAARAHRDIAVPRPGATRSPDKDHIRLQIRSVRTWSTT